MVHRRSSNNHAVGVSPTGQKAYSRRTGSVCGFITSSTVARVAVDLGVRRRDTMDTRAANKMRTGRQTVLLHRYRYHILEPQSGIKNLKPR